MKGENGRIIHSIDVDPTVHLKNPGFCTNIFCCRSASHPWSRAVEIKKSTQICAVCKDGAFRFSRYVELEQNVSCCPMCYYFFGLPDPNNRLRIVLPTISEVSERYSNGRAVSRYACPGCGTRPTETAKIFRSAAGDGEDAEFNKNIIHIMSMSLGYVATSDLEKDLMQICHSCVDPSQIVTRISNSINRLFGINTKNPRQFKDKFDVVSKNVLKRYFKQLGVSGS